MNANRFIHHGAASLGIEANVGVDLAWHGARLLTVPRGHPDADHPPPAPFLLPPIPAPMIERGARLLRRLMHHGRCGLWALYLDTAPPHAWHFYLPPQLCTADGMTANLSYPGCQVPGPGLRLAGTFRTTVQSATEQLAAELPPLDGVHFYLHTGPWLTLSAYLVVGSAAHMVAPNSVIAEVLDPDLHALSLRLWRLDST